MIVYMFAMYFLHEAFVFPLIVDLARWSQSTLADWGFMHAAYWAGLGWLPSGFVYWGTWFLECLILLALIPGLHKFVDDTDRVADG